MRNCLGTGLTPARTDDCGRCGVIRNHSLAAFVGVGSRFALEGVNHSNFDASRGISDCGILALVRKTPKSLKIANATSSAMTRTDSRQAT